MFMNVIIYTSWDKYIYIYILISDKLNKTKKSPNITFELLQL